MNEEVNIRKVVEAYAETRQEIKKVEDAVKKSKEVLEEQKQIILKYLEDNQQSSLTYKDLGTVTMSVSNVYRYPKETENVEKLMQWIVSVKGKDFLKTSLTMTATTLKKCVEEEREKIKDDMERATFLPPGLDSPHGVVRLSYKAPKKETK